MCNAERNAEPELMNWGSHKAIFAIFDFLKFSKITIIFNAFHKQVHGII